MVKRLLMLGVFLALAYGGLRAAPAGAASCAVSERVVRALSAGFSAAVASGNGGFFTPNMMWGAVVDRMGRVCEPLFKTGDAWPGSRAIAIAKAETANDFSNDKLSLSTANLYGLVVPGGSLFGLNESNPYNPVANDPRIPLDRLPIPGGIITFGGGVALYAGGQVIGAFGVSGDTSCADHAIAYKSRTAAIHAHVISPPVNDDNIVYGTTINSTQHPHCTAHDITPPHF
jgi:uncharacterized protein GlcG (DUF336 family)